MTSDSPGKEIRSAGDGTPRLAGLKAINLLTRSLALNSIHTSLRTLALCTLALPADHVVKTGFHDVVGLLSAKVFTQSGTCPCDCTSLG